MQDANFWNLFRRAAQLADCSAKSLIKLDRPDAGIRAERNSPGGSGFRLLSISPSEEGDGWPAKLVDTYSRGNDMVATYAGHDLWPFSPQIYWTATDGSGGEDRPSLSIVVSIQTDRLDTHPRVFVRSLLPVDETLLLSVAGDELLVDSHAEGELHVDPQATACSLVWRLPGGELSYAEIMMTSDYRRLTVTRTGGACSAKWELFSEFLEKGVIRRARLQSMFVPRANDVQIVAECCQAIAKRPLPLTT